MYHLPFSIEEECTFYNILGSSPFYSDISIGTTDKNQDMLIILFAIFKW